MENHPLHGLALLQPHDRPIPGVDGYTCPTPGSDGYRFQADPCRFGQYAGEAVYCDESTEGDGIVGIRDEVRALPHHL